VSWDFETPLPRRRKPLSPDLKEEAQMAATEVNVMLADMFGPRVARRVQRIRQGEAVEDTRMRRRR